MKKKAFNYLLLSIVIISVAVPLVGCDNNNNPDLNGKYLPWIKNIPSVNNASIKPIDSKMIALEIYNTAIQNAGVVDYTSKAICNSTNNINFVVGTKISVNQLVYTTKIINNSFNRDYISIASASVTNSDIINKLNLNITKFEETYVVDNTFYYRSGKCNIDEEKNITPFNYDSVLTYDNKQDYLNDHVNDTLRQNMYLINEDTILSSSVDYSKNDKYYTITFELDAESSTEDYIDVMKYMLGTKVKSTIEFTQLQIEYTVWENGLFRSANIKESCNINLLNTFLCESKSNHDIYYNYTTVPDIYSSEYTFYEVA